MQINNGRLKVHTTIIPEKTPKAPEAKKRLIPKMRFEKPDIRLPEFLKIKPRTRKTVHKRFSGRAARINRPRVRRTPAQRLLRNTSIACTLVMCVMALASLDTPWSKRAVKAVSDTVTMTVNLDETLGKLNFVRDWMPEAALVFWNMGGQDALARPVSGDVTHAWDMGQPWIEYKTSSEQPVYAADDGTVAAVSESASGEWTLMIDHDGGEQTVYAYLGKAIVRSGQPVIKGAQIAITDSGDAPKLYFEMRKDGVPTDPTSRMSGS